MEIVSDVNTIGKEEWSKYILDHSLGNIFQSPQIYDFYLEVKNYKPYLICCLDNEGQIRGILLAVFVKEEGLASFFSTRCLVISGPILDINSESNLTLTELLRALVKSARKENAVYIEFRNLFDFSDKKKIFLEQGFNYSEHLNYQVSIDEEEKIRKRVSSSKLRQIKQSISQGVEILEPTNIEQIKEFYIILKELYKNKVRKPLPDWSFFESFYRNNEIGKYFLICYCEKVIGGIMCPIYKGRIYEWYICGQDGMYRKVYPSVLATWAPIKYALENGLKMFDFMGAGRPDADYGVREFKAKFGGKLVNHGRFRKVLKPFNYKLGKLGLKIYRG